jgi:FPC/CPF motif-containing protein YcgG
MFLIRELRNHPAIYIKVENSFFSEYYPCFFGKMSFQKDLMYYGLYKDISEQSITDLANNLREMSIFLDSERNHNQKSLNTFIAIFENINENISFDSLWYEIISKLHTKDNKQWKSNTTMNLNDANFKFSFDNKLWYPVLLTPVHTQLTRKSEITILSFQPDETFIYNKESNKVFYEKGRNAIYSKIDKIYHSKRPHYITEKSSGKNIVQFLGYDFEENVAGFKYPNIF